jgi:hypothetical protein
MKANELMIGDWVFVHKPTCKGHRVDYINEMDEEIGADGEIYGVCDIRPIPLTAEILEKNGIVFDYTIKLHDDYGNPYEIKGYALHGTTKWGDDYLLQYDEDKDLHISTEIYGEITLHNINFIHELQHALRLCGIEKEIEL